MRVRRRRRQKDEGERNGVRKVRWVTQDRLRSCALNGVPFNVAGYRDPWAGRPCHFINVAAYRDSWAGRPFHFINVAGYRDHGQAARATFLAYAFCLFPAVMSDNSLGRRFYF
jgi:hypothetical protein